MNEIHNLRKAIIGITIGFILASCSSATPIPPTPTFFLDTATPFFTPTPEFTSTPEATSTPAETPTPAGPPTASATATHIPDVAPPAQGRANVIGLILWNDQPVTKAAIWLCKEFSTDNGCIDRQSVNTDRNGYYVFHNVFPGKYTVAINSFGLGWWQYIEQNVPAGQNVILNPMNIYRLDLDAISPKVGKNISKSRPTFMWEAYPSAAYYQLYIQDEKGNWVTQGERLFVNEYTPVQPLVTCGYSWYIEAYNSRGTLIAHSTPPTKQSAIMQFNVIDVAGNC